MWLLSSFACYCLLPEAEDNSEVKLKNVQKTDIWTVTRNCKKVEISTRLFFLEAVKVTCETIFTMHDTLECSLRLRHFVHAQ